MSRSLPVLVALFTAVVCFDVSASAAPECEYQHTYLGNYPKEKEPGWHHQAQGIDHDASHWYISNLLRLRFLLPESQVPPDKCERRLENVEGAAYTCYDPTLWRIPVEVDLSDDVGCDDPASAEPGKPVCARLSEVAPHLWAEGYNHYGDVDHYEVDDRAYLCVPLEGKLAGAEAGLPGAMAFFRADDLSFVAEVEAPGLGTTAAWCAIDPAGYLYSSGKRDDTRTDTVRKYEVTWDDLAGPAPTVALREVLAIPLQDGAGNPIILEKYLQGGTFTDDGRVLYLSNGSAAEKCADCGIHAFELLDTDTGVVCGETSSACVARRVAQSTNGFGAFNYEYHPGCCRAEEPEGLTWWDLAASDAPAVDFETSAGRRIDGSQLHALLLDNDFSDFTLKLDDDDVYIKHYRVDVHCEPQAGIAVHPRVVDFGDVDVGGSKAETLTIANEGDADLLVEGIGFGPGSDPGFALSSAPATPATIPPAGGEAVELTFTPAAAVLATALLEITSDDPDEPRVEVALAGTGVSLEDQLRRLLDLFDEAVGTGFLAGSGAGSSAEHRRDALRAMLEEALVLLERGELEEVCGQLHAALLHSDGERSPKDLVAGDAAADLADGIRRLRENLECSAPGAG